MYFFSLTWKFRQITRQDTINHFLVTYQMQLFVNTTSLTKGHVVVQVGEQQEQPTIWCRPIEIKIKEYGTILEHELWAGNSKLTMNHRKHSSSWSLVLLHYRKLQRSPLNNQTTTMTQKLENSPHSLINLASSLWVSCSRNNALCQITHKYWLLPNILSTFRKRKELSLVTPEASIVSEKGNHNANNNVMSRQQTWFQKSYKIIIIPQQISNLKNLSSCPYTSLGRKIVASGNASLTACSPRPFVFKNLEPPFSR